MRRVAVAFAVLATACSSGGTTSVDTRPLDTGSGTNALALDEPLDEQAELADDPPTRRPRRPADAQLVGEIEDALAAAPAGCDPLDTRQCVLPYPSNATTRTDPTTATGRRIAFPDDGLPANADGRRIDPGEWNRNDGFSPNSTLLTHVRNLDPVASELPSWTDLGASIDGSANVVLIDLGDASLVPLWAEPDSAGQETAEDSLLVVHPAVSLDEGHTYMIAMRGLVDADGHAVEPGPVFRAYRDGQITELAAIEARRADMEAGFEALATHGIDAGDLQLAWTFTVASQNNLTDRMLHIRDATLAQLGAFAPEFSLDTVLDGAETGIDGVGRIVHGTYSVPNWLTGDGGPGNGFQYAGDPNADGSPDELPTQNGVLQSPFQCNLPDAVLDGDDPGHLVQYGHGLLGDESEVNAANIRAMSNEHGAVYCATRWAGMSADDVANAAASLTDLSNFPTVADRLQQGVLNQIVLGRLMLADDGLGAHPAFQRTDGSPLVDRLQLVYDGNSQGGIMGLMLAAVSPDVERAVLGVPGMNYSLLLPRSVDFDAFAAIMEPAYPGPLDRLLSIALVQMLWDRGEGGGYVHHVVADPLPGTRATPVLMHVAFGDHQVTELAAFVAARTMDISIHRPVVAPDRSAEREPGWGLADLDAAATSAIVVWDSGAAPIPLAATPPRDGADPHEDPRADPSAREQKAQFLWDGEIRDVCDGAPCGAEPAG